MTLRLSVPIYKVCKFLKPNDWWIIIARLTHSFMVFYNLYSYNIQAKYLFDQSIGQLYLYCSIHIINKSRQTEVGKYLYVFICDCSYYIGKYIIHII